MRTLFALLFPLLLYSTPLQLGGNHGEASREYSGLAWHGEQLVLLPQYPDGQLYTLSRSDLKRAILEGSVLSPATLHFDDRAVQKEVTGYEGYEAIAFDGTVVYAVIEARTWLRSMRAYLVKGSIENGTVLMEQVVELPLPADVDNYAYESMTLAPSGILLIYEANGILAEPKALQVSRELDSITEIDLPRLPYRITDLTSLTDKKFWALNTYWRGDRKKLQVARTKNLGRIIEFQLTSEGLRSTGKSVRVNEGGRSYNWEGIVRFGEKGFLIITDTYPSSALRYVGEKP